MLILKCDSKKKPIKEIEKGKKKKRNRVSEWMKE